MLKKAFLGFMAFCAISFGFVSCSNDSDDEESTTTENSSTSTQDENSSSHSEDVDETEQPQSQVEKTIAEAVSGTYTVDRKFGVNSQKDADPMSVTSFSDATLKIEAVSDSSEKVNIIVPPCEYNAAMKYGEITIENISVSTTDNENYTFSCGEFSGTITWNGTETTVTGVSVSGTLVKSTNTLNLTVKYKVDAFVLYSTDNLYSSSTETTETSSANIISPSYSLSNINSVSDYYGTWAGTWTIMFGDYATSVYVNANTFAYTSIMMSGTYEYVAWDTDSDGNVVCYGSHTEGEANEASCGSKITFKSDGYGYFWVRAMSLFSSPAQLSKQ